MGGCCHKQPDPSLASRNLLRPLPVRTEASLTASGHDLFAKLSATARFLGIAAGWSRREADLLGLPGESSRRAKSARPGQMNEGILSEWRYLTARSDLERSHNREVVRPLYSSPRPLGPALHA
jgi:hypothetical protein